MTRRDERLEHLLAPLLGALDRRAALVALGREQRRLRRTRSSSTRRMERDPTTRAPSPNTIAGTVPWPKRCRSATRLTSGGRSIRVVRDLLQPQGGLDGRARVRGRDRVEGRGHCAASIIGRPCSWSWMSATPRRISAPSRRGARLRLALRDGARLDRRRARRRAARAARAARPRLRRPRRLHPLLHRPAAAAGVDRDGEPLPRPRHARRRAGRANRDADPDGQPARARRRPAANAVAAHAALGGPCVVVDFGTAITYDVVSARRRVPRRHHRAGRGDLARGAHHPRGRDPQDRPHRAAHADRQVDRRRDPLGRRLRLRRPGRRHRHAPARRARRGNARRSPPAASPRPSSPSARRSRTSIRCSRSPGCG